MTAEANSRTQFSLAALTGVVFASALLFGCLANMESCYRLSIQCSVLPDDDKILAHWFEDQDGVKNVSTTRTGNTVIVNLTKRHGGYELFSPPLGEFGYAGLKGMESMITKPSLLAGALNSLLQVPVMVWFGMAAVFAILIARRSNKSRRLPLS